MFKVKRINKEEVKPVKFIDEEDDKRPVRGRDIFPEIYANIFFCARKKSGKTCSIYHIIEKCSTKETRVIAFVSTLHRDPTWRAIKKMCENKGIDFTGFTSLKEGKQDILEDIVDTLENEIKNKGKDEDEEEEGQHGRGIVMPCEQEDEEESKPKRPKEKAPEIIFVFDDLSGQLSSPSIVELLKNHRHFKSKVLISSQYWNDIPLEGRG